MKVSRKIIITEINHKDLVNLFSTALTGSDMLGCDYDKDFWNGIPEKKRKGQCFEDHIADVLLNGGKVYVYDYYANGELHNEKGTILDDDENGNAMYELTLQDIVNGLQRTAEGDFKWDDPWERADAREKFDDYIDEGEYGNFDLDGGEVLMQIILFNEIIYT